MNTNPNDTHLRDFLAAKYGQAEGYMTVWRKRANTTKAFAVDLLNEAVDHIERTCGTDDVYLPNSTQAAPPEGGKRGSADTVSSLTGLFGGIDLADAKGAQSGYPENEDEAREILSSFPLQPTSTVHSGNGLKSISIWTSLGSLERPATVRPPQICQQAFSGRSSPTFVRMGARSIASATSSATTGPRGPSITKATHRSWFGSSNTIQVGVIRSNGFGNLLGRAQPDAKATAGSTRRWQTTPGSLRAAHGTAPS